MLYGIARPVGPYALARELGYFCPQFENSERHRIIIHGRPALSAAPSFDIEHEPPERASTLCAAERERRRRWAGVIARANSFQGEQHHG